VEYQFDLTLKIVCACSLRQLIINEDTELTEWRKNCLFKSDAVTVGCPYAKKKKNTS
jgi:hypothetical protein